MEIGNIYYCTMDAPKKILFFQIDYIYCNLVHCILIEWFLRLANLTDLQMDFHSFVCVGMI